MVITNVKNVELLNYKIRNFSMEKKSQKQSERNHFYLVIQKQLQSNVLFRQNWETRTVLLSVLQSLMLQGSD